MTALSMNDFDTPHSNPHLSTQSVLSFSEESLSSGDDFAGPDFVTGGHGGGSVRQSLDYTHALLSSALGSDGFLFDGLDVGFEL
jgi:hypothetical protein